MTCVSPAPYRGAVLDGKGLATEGEAVDKLRALPPFSAVASYLLKVVSDEDVPLRKLSDVIRADARLSKDMMQIANSALFGRRFPVTGVLHATAMLGFDRVRSLVTTAALKDYLGPARGMPAMVRCWRHNLACAVLCEEISRKTNLDRDFAYTAGLLHDIGRMAMLRAWLQEYTAVLDAATDANIVLTTEVEEFGIRHTRAGLLLLNLWKLPAVFSEVASRHHATPAAGQTDIVALVHFSCSLADSLGFAATGQRACQESAAVPVQSPFRDLIDRKLEDLSYRVAERINELECCLAG